MVYRATPPIALPTATARRIPGLKFVFDTVDLVR
jgi:hypothetical protein